MRWVCRKCLPEGSLSDLFKGSRGRRVCSFCNRTDEKGTIRFDKLAQRVKDCVFGEYADADAEFTPLDGDGDGYFGGSLDRYSLLVDVGLGASDAVIDALAEELPDWSWVKKSLTYVSPEEAIQAGWEDFVAYVEEHLTAPTASIIDDSFSGELFGVDTFNRHMDAGLVLSAITELVKTLRLIKSIPRGTALYRCRDEWVDTPTVQNLGPPPSERAKSNRMSRAGESFFYGAFERITAILEVCTAGEVTIGHWRTVRALKVLDLTDLPPVPGFFHRDPEERHGISFLHGFTQDLRKSVAPREREVGYLPSILTAEHFRSHLPQIDGIKYLSAKQGGGTN